MADEIEVTNLAAARDLVRLHLLDQPAETVEIAALLTSELLSNALQHGAGDPVLTLEVDETQLVVHVHDEDGTVDLAPLVIEPASARGRGLAIVDALATAWGVDPQPVGKAVWFSLAL